MTEGAHRDDWTLPELLDAEREATQDELHTSFPGRVESYDASTQTADVQPMIRRTLYTEDGEPVREQMPVLRAVPVMQLRATVGGWFVHMPIAAGDEVLVQCCERDIARWRQTGQLSDAPDSRLHHLQSAVCTPGLPSRGRLLSGLPSDALVIGKVAGATVRIQADGDILIGASATELVALANLVKARLDTIQAAFDAHTHSGGTLGGGLTGIPQALIGALAAVAAAKARAE